MTKHDMVLHKPQFMQSRRIKLKSPILHIGGEIQKLSPFEYIQTSEKIYIPNQEALAQALYKRGYLQAPKPWERIKDLKSGKALDQYIQAIKNKDNPRVTEIIELALGKQWSTAKSEDDKPIFPDYGIIPKSFRHRINHEIRPMIRDAFGQLYIPGSSIKGAIRTAIAYYMLKKQPTQLSDIEQKLQEKLKTSGKIGKSKNSLGNELFMKNLFSNFLLNYQNREFTHGSESNTDFMRCLKVTDSKPLWKNGTFNLSCIDEVLISSYYRESTSIQERNPAKYRGFIYTEMVHDVETEFILSIDSNVDDSIGITGMLSWFSRNDRVKIPFHGIEDILNICKEFAQEQWNHERNYWQRIKNNLEDVKGRNINLNFDMINEFYQNSECPFNLRLGWASGMLGTTIGLHLNDETRRGIRDECASPKNRAPLFEAPKSRRSVMNNKGEIEFVPGWVNLEILPDVC